MRITRFWLFLFIATTISDRANAWTKTNAVDKMTDAKSVVLSQTSKGAVWAGKRATLMISLECGGEKKLALQHPWLVGEVVHAMIRIDKQEPFEALSAGKEKMLLIGYDGNSDSIVDQMENGKTLTVRYEDVSENVQEAEFTIVGLKSTLEGACRHAKDHSH